MPRIFILTVAVLELAFANFAFAKTVPESRYESGRGAGMGQALIPFADDGASSLFYNPAGLAKLHGVHFEPVNFGLYSNTDFVSHFNRNSLTAPSLSSYGSKLSPKSGYPGFGGFVLPNFSMHDFAVGTLYDMRVAAEKKSDGSIHYRSDYRFIPTAGFGLRLASGVLRLGYSFQYVNRAKGDVTVPGNASPLAYSNNLAEGKGFSHNAGFVLTLPYQYLPSFNLVARNIGTLKYSGSPMLVGGTGSSKLQDEPMTLDAALGMVTHLGKGLDLNSSFEYRDFTSTSGAPILGRYAMGLEFAFRNSFFIRGGWSAMYPSAGIGFKRKTSEMNFSWSNEDVGTTYHSASETKYMFQYVMRAF